MKMAKFILPAVMVGLMSTTAFGSLSFNVVEQTVVPGYVAHEIVWNGPSDWTSAGLLINLTNGSTFQQSPFGTDSAPSTALTTAFPDLAYDTYVGIQDDGTAGIAGGCGDCGGGPLSMDGPQISVSWFNNANDNTSPVRIGMITLSEDAQGTWMLISQGVVTSGSLPIPEPASLALLGLGGLAVLRRR